MSRPKLLDLFCGAGGAAMGYHRAGFDVYGVDCNPQPRYPFEFHQGDAMRFPLDGFDAIHASPPCQDHSSLSSLHDAHGTGWMLAATISRLRENRKPWIVENVVGAPLPSAIELCGASFGLGAWNKDLSRHRRFETSFALLAPPCQHRRGRTVGVYGHGMGRHAIRRYGRDITVAECAEAMDIDWMTRAELAQAIPPAYTQFIGEQLLAHLGRQAA